MNNSKFIHIATGTAGNKDEIDFVLYALDTEGIVWYFSVQNGQWQQVTSKREEYK